MEHLCTQSTHLVIWSHMVLTSSHKLTRKSGHLDSQDTCEPNAKC